MQFVTMLGLAVCLGMIYLRARAAKGGTPSSSKQRLQTAKILLVALLAWLVIQFKLQHLDHVLSGNPAEPPSAWERVVTFLAGKD